MDNYEKREQALERERIECVFFLSGGELEDDPEPGSGARYWYEGAPDYLGRSDLGGAASYECFTLVWDHSAYGTHTPPMDLTVPYQAAPYAVHVGTYIASGERECWHNGLDPEHRTEDEECPLCEGPWDEDGHVYIGVGWGEVVYRRLSESERLIRACRAMADRMYSDTRADGAPFVRLMHDSPDWMTEVCRAGHLDSLPDDDHFTAIRECVAALADFTGDEDDLNDFIAAWADGMVDVYTRALLDWTARQGLSWSNEAWVEGLVSDGATTEQRLRAGQYRWLEAVAHAVVECITEINDEEAGY